MSVILGDNYRSNGMNTYEIGLLQKDERDIGLTYDCTEDVYCDRSKEEVTIIMQELQKLKSGELDAQKFLML